MLNYETLLSHLSTLEGARCIIAIAGPPGAGKSTLAAALQADLNATNPGRAAILAMDGFHYDNELLKERDILHRKGAPDTFDTDGLKHILQRLKRDGADEVAIPVFDRSIEISRAGASTIPRSAQIVLVEGNYLLLRTPPWDDLRNFFDLRVLIHCEDHVLEHRLRSRWLDFDYDEATADRKLHQNDLPNAKLVSSQSDRPDIIYQEKPDVTHPEC